MATARLLVAGRSLLGTGSSSASPRLAAALGTGSQRFLGTTGKEVGKEPNFVIIAYDHNDADAFERRMQAREAHLCRSRFFRDEGKIIVGGAITDDTGKMVGSCILTNFDSKAEVEDFVKNDPYVMRGVWATYRIEPFRPAKTLGITDAY